jgi:hypothetical protein
VNADVMSGVRKCVMVWTTIEAVGFCTNSACFYGARLGAQGTPKNPCLLGAGDEAGIVKIESKNSGIEKMLLELVRIDLKEIDQCLEFISRNKFAGVNIEA